MRNGNPCLVHHTGGLKDTVKEGVSGFTFDGESYDDKIHDMVRAFNDALSVYMDDQARWKKIKANAKRQRFTWEKSVDEYYRELYLLTE